MPRDDNALNQFSIKPIYDVAHGTNQQWFPFQLPLAYKDVTFSNGTMKGLTETLNSVTAYETTSDLPSTLAKFDTVGMYDFGDDTNMDVIFFVKPKSPFEVTQCFISAMFGMNVSVWTSGNFNMGSILLEILLFHNTELTSYNTIFKRTYETGHADLAATGLQLFNLQGSFSGDSIDTSDKIGMHFKMTTTGSQTDGTFQSGLFPLYPWNITNTEKLWYESGLMSHALPSLDSALQAFKHQLSSSPIDVFGDPAHV